MVVRIVVAFRVERQERDDVLGSSLAFYRPCCADQIKDVILRTGGATMESVRTGRTNGVVGTTRTTLMAAKDLAACVRVCSERNNGRIGARCVLEPENSR
jgi:hypothetical protein